jgi:hypothetical protein
MERVEKCVKESGQEATFFFVAEVAESTVESNLETLSERNVEGFFFLSFFLFFPLLLLLVLLCSSCFCSERQTANTNSSDPNPPSSSSFSYFPTYVWAWVIVMLVMIGFVISSINSLSGVQVPPRVRTKQNKKLIFLILYFSQLLSAEQAASKKNK